jgi:hypothetical protein
MKDLKDICEGIFDKENKNNVGNNFGAYSEFDILKKKFLDKNNYFKFNEYGEIGFRVRMKIPEICNDFIVQKTKTNPNSISINLGLYQGHITCGTIILYDTYLHDSGRIMLTLSFDRNVNNTLKRVIDNVISKIFVDYDTFKEYIQTKMEKRYKHF